MVTRKTASKATAGKTNESVAAKTQSPAKSASKVTVKKTSNALKTAKKAATKKPRGLGRGLDVLLGADAMAIESLGKAPATGSAAPTELSVELLVPGKFQPRGRIDESGLEELAASIRSQGIMQPVLVRALSGEHHGKYEIIAGERRFRAAQLAGLTELPVLIREVSDENAAIMALIENIQREDLNPLEEAKGVRRLLNEFGLTHEQAAQAIGRSRSATSNLLRLLNLAEPVQTMLLAGDIDMGHARALLAVAAAQQIMLANEIINRRLSVRQAEKLVADYLREQDTPKTAVSDQRARTNGDAARLEQALSDFLGTKVTLKVGKRNRGQLLIDFHDWDHLNALLERQGFAGVLDG